MAITTIDELEKAINSGGIGNNAGARNLLRREANKLMKLIQTYIDAYYDSYEPEVYKRTYRFKHSLRWEDVKVINDILVVNIYFDPEWSNHESYFGGEEGFVPILLDRGWEWKNNPHIKHLSEYDGFHFIDKAIAEYNATNDLNIKITIDAKYKGSTVDNRSYLRGW